MRLKLNVVTLIDPKMCEGCRFNTGPKEMILEGQRITVPIMCQRLDCDNWDHGTMRRDCQEVSA